MALRLRVSVQAQRDIEDVLGWTLKEFGERKYDEYRELIKEAILKVAQNPESCRSRPELHPSARTFHLATRGRRARHFLLLRVAPDGVVEIGRLLYDGMDLASHLPEGFEA